MSRCFPFPPPGYEKKARTDEVDLLTKEKLKEKKHKKEKDKKREGKEKKDKERSKDKHKEKKDRKEKHKDKKKDKDREKDKKKSSDEKRIEGYNGGKPSEISHQPGDIKGSKFVEDLGRRIGDEEGTRSQRVENLSCTDPRRAEGMGRVAEKYSSNKVENVIGTDQRNAEGMGRVAEKYSDNKVENVIGTDQRNAEGMGRVAEKYSDNKVENLIGTDQRNAEGMGRVVDKNFSTRVENLTSTDQWRAEGMGRVVEKDFNNRGEGKEINYSKKLDDKKADVQRSQDGSGGMGNEMVQNFTGMDQRRTGSMAGLMEKDAEKSITGKEKEKNKSKANDDKQGDKHKNREKKGKGKDKDKDKEKKKEKEKEKLKEKGDPKNNKQDKLRDSSKDPPLDTLNIKPSQIPKDSDISAAAEGNHRKRKDLETNGFLHDNDIRPNKLLKPTVSSHPLMENGRKLEPFQIATQSASDRHGTGNNLKAENKERKVNGIIEAPGSLGNSTKSSFASLHISENGGASTKPPHPDSKYLNQILAVPKMEDWSDFDDQEWLFSSNNLQTKKPKVASSGVEERPEVWAEAIRIESADVCALPYVIPY